MTTKTAKYTYSYIHDHLGSTSMVLDVDGNISQSVTYVPYGEIFVEERNGAWNSPYLFNSKELDEETGLYYYGARYLNPTSGMWLSVDPLWEKNIDASPYSYCHGNPVNKVDVMGLDDYGVDDNGYIFFIKKTDSEKDRLIAGVNRKKDGEIKGLKYKKNGELDNESMELTKGVLSKIRSKSISLQEGEEPIEGHYLTFGKKKEESINVFIFLADNTGVEWGLFTSRKDNIETLENSILGTSHKENKEYITPTLCSQDIEDGYYIDFHFHNHPTDYTVNPEQNREPSRSDKDFAKSIRDRNKFGNSIELKVYSRGDFKSY